MLTLLLWLILLLLYWPLALLVWLVAFPFRLLGIAVEGIFDLLRAVILLPARIVRRIF